MVARLGRKYKHRSALSHPVHCKELDRIPMHQQDLPIHIHCMANHGFQDHTSAFRIHLIQGRFPFAVFRQSGVQ